MRCDTTIDPKWAEKFNTAIRWIAKCAVIWESGTWTIAHVYVDLKIDSHAESLAMERNAGCLAAKLLSFEELI